MEKIFQVVKEVYINHSKYVEVHSKTEVSSVLQVMH